MSHPVKTHGAIHRLVFIFISALGCLGIVEFFFPNLWVFSALGQNNYYPQVMSLMINPNPFSVLMAMGVACGIFMHKQRWIPPHNFYLGMGFLLMALALSASRNGWMVFAALMVFGVLLRVLSLKEAAIYSAILLVMVLFFPNPTYRIGLGESDVFPLLRWIDAALSQYGVAIPEGGIRLLASSDPTSTAFSRFVLWKAAIAQILAHPLTGTGIGTFAQHIGLQVMGRVGLHAHNLFLNLGAETGIPGLLLFIGFLGQIIRRTLKQGSMATLLIGLLLVSQLPDFFVADGTFMVMAAYFVAIACNARGCHHLDI